MAAKSSLRTGAAANDAKYSHISATARHFQELLMTLTHEYENMHHQIMMASGEDGDISRPDQKWAAITNKSANRSVLSRMSETRQSTKTNRSTRLGAPEHERDSAKPYVPAIDHIRASIRTNGDRLLLKSPMGTGATRVFDSFCSPNISATLSRSPSNVRPKTSKSRQSRMSRKMGEVQDKVEILEHSLSLKKASMRQTPNFDIFIGCVILVNSIAMAFSFQFEGYRAAKSAGIASYSTDWESILAVFSVFEYLFCSVFTLEIIFRAWIHGCIYFLDPLGLFELLIVVVGIVELFILEPMELGSGTNFSLLRIARVFRLMRVMRIVRVLKLFSSLRVLTKTIASSITSLTWALVLIGLIVCSAGLVACQLLTDTVGDPSLDIGLRSWVFTYYGTSTRSMYSMVEATLSGCWPNYARPLINDVSGWWSIFWTAYACLIVFAVLSVIRAIFLKETMQVASGDADTMIQEHILKRDAYREKLKEAFEAIDIGGEGEITREDFEVIITVPKVQALMSVLDFEVHDATVVFHMLQEENAGHITYREFLSGIMRLKGTARQVDVVSIQRDCKYLMERLLALSEAVEKSSGVNPQNKPSMVPRSTPQPFDDHQRKNGGSFLEGHQGPRRSTLVCEAVEEEVDLDTRVGKRTEFV